MGQCLLCDGNLVFFREYIFKTEEFKEIYKDKSVYRCNNCGLVQIDISKVTDADLTEYYRYAYRNIAKITSIKSEASKLMYTARGIGLLRLVEAHKKMEIRRVFEVGAGYGYNLKVLKEAHPDAKIFTDEIDEDFKETMNAQQASLEDGPYDVIILSHVLEHFRRPQDLLRASVNSLSPGGVIVAEVPNDLLGLSSCTPCDEPHTTFFSRETFETMVQIVSEANLNDVVITGPIHRHFPSSNSPPPVRSKLKMLVPSPVRRLRRVLIRFVKDALKAKIPDFTTPTENGRYMRSAITRSNPL